MFSEELLVRTRPACLYSGSAQGWRTWKTVLFASTIHSVILSLKKTSKLSFMWRGGSEAPSSVGIDDLVNVQLGLWGKSVLIGAISVVFIGVLPGRVVLGVLLLCVCVVGSFGRAGTRSWAPKHPLGFPASLIQLLLKHKTCS